MKDLITLAALVSLVAVSFWMGKNYGTYYTTKQYQETLIEMGLAEYAIEYEKNDLSDVHRVFRWKVKP